MNSTTLQVGVKAFLANEQGKYLLTKRTDKYKNIQGGPWDIVGGRIEAGSPLIENLKREVDEEVGLTIIGDPTLFAAQDILLVPGKHIVRLTYIATAVGEVKLQAEEAEDFNWYSWEELKQLANLDKFVREIVANYPEPALQSNHVPV